MCFIYEACGIKKGKMMKRKVCILRKIHNSKYLHAFACSGSA